ncbi:MAG: M48 family metalloprotease, partial [Ktedonobacteraceae bacterium]
MHAKALTFDRFTEHARQALALAQQAALRLGHNFLDPEHLLLGIIALPDSAVSSLLRTLGAAPETLRAAIEALLPPSQQVVGDVKLTERTKRVIEFAVLETVHLHHRYLSAEHLLLGILSADEKFLCNMLYQQGISLDAVRAEVVRMYCQILSGQDTFPLDEASGDKQPGSSVKINSARQQQAMAYARSMRKGLFIYVFVVLLLLVALFLFTDISPSWPTLIPSAIGVLVGSPLWPVLAWHPVAGWFPVLVLAGFVLIGLLVLLFALPLNWFMGFAIPRRYGLRKDTALNWLVGKGKTWLVLFIQNWLFVELIFLLIATQPQIWWIWAALAQFLYSLVQARFAVYWLLPWLNKLTPLPEGPLTERLHTLLTRLHLPACQFCQVQVSHRTDAANAFFIGWGRGRLVLLTDTLIQQFTLDEIEVILAHELGHLVHHDIWMRLLMRGLTVLSFLYLLDQFFIADGTPHNAQAFFGITQQFLPLLGLILLIGFMRLTRRYQRYQEYQADELALQATGKVQAFKDAMTRLTDLNMLVTASTRGARHPTT